MSRSLRLALRQQHPVRLLVVVGLHGAFLWALVTGLRIHSPSPGAVPMAAHFLPPTPLKPLPPLQTVQVETLAPPQDPPKIPPLIFPPEDPPAVVREPEVPIAAGSGSNAVRDPVMTAPTIDPRSPLTQPDYPPAARREGIEGNLALEVLVGTNGRVLDARVARSSGSSLLDQAAVDEARRRWKLRPGTRDGVPIEQWYTLKVVFRLENR